MVLHICCAPCSTHVATLLREQFVLTGFFYNPNIEPADEFARRGAAAEEFARQAQLALVKPPYRPEEWHARIAGLEGEPEGGARCTVCFRLRLERAAAYAKAQGHEYFATTLSVGPRKSARTINRVGAEVAEEYGSRFYAADFKKQHGLTRSIHLSKALGLYRQDYCGCLFSKLGRKGLRPSPEEDVRAGGECDDAGGAKEDYDSGERAG